jgi:excisionase family DNA binding protein
MDHPIPTPPTSSASQPRKRRQLPRQRAFRVDEAAHILGLGRTKTYELITEGRLRTVLIDGRRRAIG